MKRWVGLGLTSAGLAGMLLAQQPTRPHEEAVTLPAITVGIPPERIPPHGFERMQELERIASEEQKILRAYRGNVIDKFRHMFTAAGRDEYIFYDARTGEPLHIEPRNPKKPTYRQLTSETPDREFACRLMGLGKPVGALKTRIEGIERRLEKRIGHDVQWHSGKRSDLDCFMPRTGHLLHTWKDIYLWNQVPLTGNILSESAGNPLAGSDKGARGLTQQLPGFQTRMDALLRKQGKHFDWRDPYQNAALGSALLQVRAKIRESYTVAQSDYHAGVHNVNFVLLNGSERTPPDSAFTLSSLNIYIAGMDPTLRTWQDKAVRRKYSMTFGIDSESYTSLNAANEEVYDSVMAAIPQSDVYVYRLEKQFTLPQLSELSDMPLDSLKRFNFHTPQRGGYVYFGHKVDIDGLVEDNWWREVSPRLRDVWADWNAEPGPWSALKSRMYADAFESAGNPYMALALRSDYGDVETLPSLEKYRASPTRNRILAGFSPMSMIDGSR